MTVRVRRYVVGMSNTSDSTGNEASEPQVVTRQIRKALLAGLSVRLRNLHVQVLTQTLKSGTPVRPDALAVVLAAHEDFCDDTMQFSAAHVQELLWFGLAEFCEDYGIVPPNGCHEALHGLLALGVATKTIDTAGDPVGEVFAAFRELAAC